VESLADLLVLAFDPLLALVFYPSLDVAFLVDLLALVYVGQCAV